jgi:acetyl-CoA acyltransferase
MGVKNGKMIGMRSDDLTANLVKALLERNPSINNKNIEDIVMGCAFPEGPQGMLMAKGVAILSDLPETTTGKVVNRFCGSSMDALHQLSQAVNSNDIDCGIACGAEDMFGVPMGGFSPSFHPELYEKEFYMGMGETAENLSKELDISREDQEDFAVNSHKKALEACQNGNFENEIIPINFNGNEIKKDEGPREPNVEKIKSLDPAFDSDGTITAATASPISIGASAILVSSNKLAEEAGVKPEFKILSRAIAGVDWTRMGMGPLPATEKALKKSKFIYG